MRKRRWAGLGSIGNSNVRLDLVVYISRRQWGGVNEGGHGVWNSEKKKKIDISIVQGSSVLDITWLVLIQSSRVLLP